MISKHNLNVRFVLIALLVLTVIPYNVNAQTSYCADANNLIHNSTFIFDNEVHSFQVPEICELGCQNLTDSTTGACVPKKTTRYGIFFIIFLGFLLFFGWIKSR